MKLFESVNIGALTLANRIVMAPMTRSRAVGGVPNELHVQYYRERASAGLLVTEGTAPSPNGLGYARIPGIYNEAQVNAWRAVTDAVHDAKGHIFVQLMHVGRIAHPLNLPEGARVLAPSAITASGAMYTDQGGPLPHPTPEAMTLADIAAARQEFATAARNARAAGFDGIELHGANGYLLEQFLHPHTNLRSDAYGGSVEARTRFILEVASAASDAIGADRVGIRLSPFSTFNDLPAVDRSEVVTETYSILANRLSGLAYLHLVQNPHGQYVALEQRMRKEFKGAWMINGGFDATTAEQAVTSGRADLVSFGRPFISHPDWVRRVELGLAAVAPDPATFYTPG
ncbi:MAG TPA: alkene reductase, partial [Polyangiaceae bacterium]